jgi:hypothetical protein
MVTPTLTCALPGAARAPAKTTAANHFAFIAISVFDYSFALRCAGRAMLLR